MENTQEVQEKIETLLSKIPKLKKEIGKKIVGQHQAINQLIVGLLASGHILLEGVPGLGKTMMAQTLAEALALSFRRIQFTPDLMPADILGTEILQTDQEGNKFFKFNQGPVFANFILADEINRTPPKTQSALLELMQEYAVSYAGKRYPLPKPFFLIATQNPIEQAGTFPLPEAQVDRFLLFVKVGYPTEVEETEILASTTKENQVTIRPILSDDEIIKLQSMCRQVTIAPGLIDQVSKLVRNSRSQTSSIEIIKEYVSWGAGPRAGQALILAAKGHALINGRYAVIPDDLRAMMTPALQHRIILNFKAQSENISINHILAHLSTF